jgi:hypothetical protein
MQTVRQRGHVWTFAWLPSSTNGSRDSAKAILSVIQLHGDDLDPGLLLLLALRLSYHHRRVLTHTPRASTDREPAPCVAPSASRRTHTGSP